MDLIELSENECNKIFDYIGYKGKQEVRNMNSLKVIITYLKHLFELHMDIFLKVAIDGISIQDMCDEYDVSDKRIQRFISKIQKHIMADFIDFINDGCDYGEVTTDLRAASLCLQCGILVRFEPVGYPNGDTPVSQLIPMITDKCILRFLNTKNFENYLQLRSYIITKGKQWYSEEYIPHSIHLHKFEESLGINWRDEFNLIYG